MKRARVGTRRKERTRKIEKKKWNIKLKKLKIKRDDFFMIVFALLGIAFIIAFYLYLKKLTF